MATAGCPDDEALARVAAGDAAGDERDRVMLHLDTCGSCRRGLAALAAMPPLPADSFVGGDHSSTFPDLPSDVITARVPPSPRPAGAAPVIPALGDRIGRYVALRIVGRGGMGIVVAAHDPELDRQVAIKLVHPRVWRAASDGARNLLRLEARAMARLVHPNVVAVHDLGTVGDQLFVAMELVAGSSLDRWLAARPRPYREILAMCCEAGKGIAAAHRAGLVHRDVKPHNVLVDDSERPRIADFGLAVLGRTDPRDDSTPAGTPAYMSPEQHAGTAVTAASDQFSFCVMLYEALYGERPFAGETAAAIHTEITEGRLRDAPDGSKVPSRIRRILVRGLATDPAARFPTMDALLAALVPPPRSRWRLVAAAAVLAAAAGAGAMLLARRPEDPIAAARRAAEARIAAVWSRPARDAVAATLAGSAAHAATTRTRVLAGLDDFVTRWTSARLDVARAARDGEQAPAATERLQACLDRRLDEMRALVGALSAGGPGVATAAIDSVNALTPPQVCIDRDVMAVRPPPEEPRRRARFAELSRALDDTVALDRVGLRKEAASASARVLADVRALDHPPLLAEALMVNAQILEQMGESEAALASYREVPPVAAAAGDTALEARAWIAVTTMIINAGRGRPPDDVLVATSAAVARAGTPPDLRRSHQRALALVAVSEGRYTDAEAILRAVLAEMPTNTPERAHVLLGIGTALGEQQKFEEALPVFEEARDAAEAIYGPDHPELATFWTNIEVSLHNLGRYEEALKVAHRMLELSEHDSLSAGLAIMYEGGALLAIGKYEEAMARYEQASTIFRATGNRRQEFEVLMNIGAAKYNLDDLDGADAALARALEIGHLMFDKQPAQLTFSTALRGMVAADRGDLAASARLCGEAVALAEAEREDHPDLQLALQCVARAHREGGHADLALAYAERALVIADRQPIPEYRMNARTELAMTLHALGRDRPRRRTLVKEALALEPDPIRRASLQKSFREDLR